MAKVTTKQLAVYAANQLEAGKPAAQVSRDIAAILVHERRSRDVLQFARALETELHSRGSTQVTLTSAYKVHDAIKQQLADVLGVTKPHFDEVIDPAVIGGVHAQTLDTQVDLTVRGQLMQLKRNVTEEK